MSEIKFNTIDDLLTYEEVQGKIQFMKYLQKHNEIYKQQGCQMWFVVLPLSVTPEILDEALKPFQPKD